MDIDILAQRVKEQADRLFPNRTDQSMFLKMYSEMGELAGATNNLETADEMADIFIMLLDYAKRKDINLSMAIQRKMGINDNRQWIANKLGVMQHVD